MAKTDDLVRVHIVHPAKDPSTLEDHEISVMNIYVDTTFNVKVGDKITLKDSDQPELLWQVIGVYETVQRTSINRGWNNNI
jgi:hypothetical protein